MYEDSVTPTNEMYSLKSNSKRLKYNWRCMTCKGSYLEEELKNNTITFKNIKTGEQATVTLEEFLNA